MNLPSPLPILRSILADAADVSAAATGGIHIAGVPQDERRPRIALHSAGGARPRRFRGGAADTSRAGYDVARVQVTCLAADKPTAARLADRASIAIEAFRGSVTVDDTSFPVAWAECETPEDLPAVEQSGTTPTHGVMFDVRLMLSHP